ncbi:glycosyl hydrolase family 17 protein [Alkalitalea saponilacus]|uniref:Endo-1,3-beta-glucanase btgC n=1 Tax=Alkalitalea saponilacus TaxID=889453 RepID=A0A1T5DYD6_9BACT|nr:glycosyl hydrolase family 17 protein [Alkalitalea saponilacus]ASB49149.1 glycosyl hydrolase family 17 [Alkalitalea saponilacus]SKB76737.1 Exo-beta-1,3-glucanase, GH17 family [Alkalitalea saponilacus]
MKKHFKLLIAFIAVTMIISCSPAEKYMGKTAADILGNPEYQAISYGGYREISREIQPTIPQLKEDMKILSAMGIKLLRTYNVHYDEAANLLEAIRQMKDDDPEFEMYVMLGAWIDCKNAWTDLPDRIRSEESDRNAVEIARAVELTQLYPDIVLIIAVGNEAMVHWAWDYYVEPAIILNWVNYLQDLKQKGELPETLWITSSDDFSSWGGGGSEYHVEDLTKLMKAVDFISMHIYPMHYTHYQPHFWGVRDDELHLSDLEKIDAAMLRAKNEAIDKYNSVVSYMQSLGIDKPVHIGETGWATVSNEFYGADGARAIDEYKSALYYWHIREWTNREGITCFYFEAFDEKWKDSNNPLGSENHFGLINLQAQAKYAIWDLVDEGVFNGLTRDGMPITKTYNGDKEAMMKDVLVPPTDQEIRERISND